MFDPMSIEDTIAIVVEGTVRRVVKEELAQAALNRDDLMTVELAASKASIGQTTLKAWIREGVVKSYGHGRISRVRWGDVMAAMSRGPKSKAASVEQAAVSVLCSGRRKGRRP